MSRFVEDLLCGIMGYGFGMHNRQISEAQAENLITSYLRDIPLEKVIDHWTKANGYDGLEGPITLIDKTTSFERIESGLLK